MDPITTAIIAAGTAAAAGATAGLTEAATSAIKDAYSALKAAITSKFGDKSDLADAVAKVEKNPQAPARQSLLAEEMVNAGADKDDDLLRLAKAITDQLPQSAGGKTITQTAHGDGNIQAADGSSVSISGAWPPPKK